MREQASEIRLFRVLGEIEDKLISQALALDERLAKRKKHIRFAAMGAAAAAAVVIAGSGLGGILAPENLLMVASAQMPEGSIYKEMEYEQRKEILNTANERNAALNGFYCDTVRTFLTGGEGNRVFSPVCVYNGLSMAAEITDGNTRAQILELLGEEDIGSLRTDTKNLWLADYRPDYTAKQITASSLWLDESIPYKRETLDILAKDHFASAFSGKMGSDMFDRALQGWLNNQTGGLLKKYVDKLTMKAPEGTEFPLLEIASTVNFYGKWHNKFAGSQTYTEVFHSQDGDKTCDFMHREKTEMRYFWGKKFSGGSMGFKDNGASIRFILPDEGYEPEELLNDPEAMFFISGGNFMDKENSVTDGETCGSKWLYVDLAVPKFDIAENIDLGEGLMKLGITDIFDMEKADLSPLTTLSDFLPAAAARMTSASRVMIDEEGCRAVSYIEINFNAGAAAPPDEYAELKLDRPFLFTILTMHGQPLFTGIVRDPTILS